MVRGEIMRIGIVGQGYVGSAVREVFSKHYETNTFDLNGDCTCRDMEELIDSSDVIFVCVPTPMKKDGSCDTSIVEGVVHELNDLALTRQCSNRIIAIKSTIPPGTTNRLNKECEYVSVIFNPEFLTEANFIDDFKNQDRVIIGGERPSTTELRQVYSLVFPDATIVKTGSKTAEMVKYMTNTFLATKVSFANEMKMICDELKIDYDKVVEYSTYDERLGKSHWAVPGPDGKLGFGGSCFPKDLNALISLSKDMRLYLHTLQSVWKTNLKVRPEKDWEELKGRAVVDDNDQMELDFEPTEEN
jgi:UDPglucose 6-dehydrogenase